MAISCVVEYSEDYGHERFYGITPVKRQDSMGYQGRSPWLVKSLSGLEVRGWHHPSGSRRPPFLFTEGITKAMRADGQEFGEAGRLHAARSGAELALSDLK